MARNDASVVIARSPAQGGINSATPARQLFGGKKSNTDIDLSLLSTKEERDLIKKLIFFGDTLDLCIRSNSPHHITTYLMETADLFHSFYEKCKVLNPDNEKLSPARLSLVKAVKERVKQALELLGVSAPDRM